MGGEEDDGKEKGEEEERLHPQRRMTNSIHDSPFPSLEMLTPSGYYLMWYHNMDHDWLHNPNPQTINKTPIQYQEQEYQVSRRFNSYLPMQASD